MVKFKIKNDNLDLKLSWFKMFRIDVCNENYTLGNNIYIIPLKDLSETVLAHIPKTYVSVLNDKNYHL